MKKLKIIGVWKEGYCDEDEKREIGEIDFNKMTRYPSNLKDCIDLFVVDEDGEQIGQL